jgi:hypothetical protein
VAEEIVTTSSSLRLRNLYAGALLLIFLPATFLGQDGKQLFHKMQVALGGSDKIATIAAFDQCVRADAWGDDGKFYGVVYKRTRWIKPNFLRLDQVGPGNSYVLYFDGKSGWEILPDKGFVELSGDELAFAKGYLSGVNLPLPRMSSLFSGMKTTKLR